MTVEITEDFFTDILEILAYGKTFCDDPEWLKCHQECSELLKTGTRYTVIKKMLSGLHFFFKAESNIDGPFNYFIWNICDESEESEIPELIRLFGDICVRNSDEHPETCLKLLSIMFNHLSTKPVYQYDIFLSFLDFCVKTKNVKSLMEHIENIEEWIVVWNINNSKKQVLYSKILNILEHSDHDALVVDIKIRLLKTYVGDDITKHQSQIRPCVQSLIVAAVSLDNFFHFEKIVSLKAIQVLDKKSFYLQLLTAFSSGDYHSYSSLASTFASDLKSCGINTEKAIHKIRILTLCSLAEGKSSVPFDLIMQKLKISRDDLEMIIVEAISSGLVVARVDQLAEAVVINSVMFRSIEPRHWTQLSERLQTWKTDISKILQVIQNAKGQVSNFDNTLKALQSA